MNCYWKNECKKTHLCCNFCKQNSCEYRCKDDYKNCIYFIKEDIRFKNDEKLNESVIELKENSEELILKIKKYSDNNKISLKSLSIQTGISRNVLKKILVNTDCKITNTTIDKLKKFIEVNKI